MVIDVHDVWRVVCVVCVVGWGAGYDRGFFIVSVAGSRGCMHLRSGLMVCAGLTAHLHGNLYYTGNGVRRIIVEVIAHPCCFKSIVETCFVLKYPQLSTVHSRTVLEPYVRLWPVPGGWSRWTGTLAENSLQMRYPSQVSIHKDCFRR